MLNLSIRSKITLACVGLSVISALVISLLAYHRLSGDRVASVEGNFKAELGQLTSQADGLFRYMERDLLILSQLPPIDGLGRSLLHAGVDQRDGSTVDQWKQRLATIFESMMRQRPQYFQIRLVGVADSGRELVRVERRGNNIYRVAEPLQRKSQESYFAPSLAGKRGEVYYSAITLNREEGVVDPRQIVTLRFTTPVFDEVGEIYGFLVINIDYKNMMLVLSSNFIRQSDYYIVDSYGNYMAYGPRWNGFQFAPAGAGGHVPSVVRELSDDKDPADTFMFTDDTGVRHFVVTGSSILRTESGRNYVRLARSIPEAELLASVREFQRVLIFGAMLMVTTCGIASALLVSWIMRPVYRTIDAIGQYAQGELKKLPDVADTELQHLSAANEAALTELMQNSRSGLQALQKYQVIFETVVDGLITIDSSGSIESLNPAAEAMFGYLPEQVIGQNVGLLMPEPYFSEHDRYIENYLRTGERKIIGIGREVAGRRSDGSTFPIELAVSEVREADRVFFIGMVKDISERKAKEEQLRRTLTELKKSNRELDDFAYIASHDLREPMRGMQMHAQKLLQKYAGELDDDGHRRLERLNELADRLQKLVNDLLFFSRLGRSALACEESDLNDVVKESVEALQSYLQERGGEVRVLNPLPKIVCDRVKMQSVFINLITNGLKYNDRPSKIIEIDCLPELPHKGELLNNVFLVRDNGIGIEEMFYEDIFRLFKRLNAEDRYGYGTGAGLTFVRKSIELQGGRIWVESEPEKGSTFYFCLNKMVGINYSTQVTIEKFENAGAEGV